MTEKHMEQKKFEPTGLLDSKGEIILDAGEWYSIQAYVEFALNLPTSQADLRRELGVKLDENWQKFARLRLGMLDVYRAANHHCTYWRDSVYPDLVGLADDIAGYARTCSDTYGRLERLSKEIGDDPDAGDETFGIFRELVDALIGEAQRREGKAANVSREVSEFCSMMKASGEKLKNVQGEAKSELDALKKDTAGIDQGLGQLQQQLAKAKRDYAKNVGASRSVPAYAWIPIAGWIAGGVVGGVSAGEKKRLQGVIDSLSKKIGQTDAESKRRHMLMLRYRTATDQLAYLQEDLSGIEPLLAELVGVWHSIGSDLQEVQDTLSADKDEADALWRLVDFGAVRDSWDTVGGKAETWRRRAFIAVEKGEPLAA